MADRFEVASQLPFAEPVVVLDLLLFLQCRTVVTGPTAADMHPGGLGTAIQRTCRTSGFVNQRAETTVDASLGAGVTSHEQILLRRHNRAAGWGQGDSSSSISPERDPAVPSHFL